MVGQRPGGHSLESKGIFAAAAAAAALVLAPAAVALVDDRSAAQPRLAPPAAAKSDTRLESRLADVARAARERGAPQALDVARSSGLETTSARVTVVVEGVTAEARAAVAAAGGTVEATAGTLIEALVPPAGLDALSRSPSVERVRAPRPAYPLGVESQGVNATGAASWHAAGQRGSGARVAIIDLGFAGYTARISAGELPAGLIAQDYCGGMGAPEEHGTAVAEIVHEMAPDAQLYLICIDTEVDLANALAYVKSNGITIVNHSVGWFVSSRGDGSGGPGTPDAIVADASASGILWVNAAGNQAQRHWSGSFSDLDASGRHDFAPGDEGNSLSLGTGQEVCGFLRWDAWPTTNQDFDLYLLRADGTIVAGSDDQQNGNDPPVEALCYENTGSSQTFSFAIERFDGSTAPLLDLHVTRSGLQYLKAAGSVVEPASSPSAFAIGAICWQSNALEPYSSLGPTIDGRVKPDLAGQAAVTSAVYGIFGACGSSGFTGTSASAPHTAGAAALWKGLTPLSSSAAIRAALEADALDLGVAGTDVSFGAGKLQLPTSSPQAVTAAGAAAPTTTSVSVAGTVNPRGLATTYWWEYGTTAAYGSQTAAGSAGAGRVLQPVAAAIAGLVPGTEYHFRLAAANLFGTTHGPDLTVSTLSQASVPPPGGGGGGGGGGGSGGGAPADLRVSLGASTLTPSQNEAVEIRLNVSNKDGVAAATGVRASIVLPAGTTLLGPPAFERGSGCAGSTTLACDLDFLPSNAVTVIRFSVDVGSAGTKVVTAGVASSGADGDSSDNSGSLTLTVRAPQVAPPAVRTPPATVRTFSGTSRRDVLRATTGRDILRGLGGDDTLLALAGADRVFGGSGSDRVSGGTGDDLLDGGLGKDVLDGGAGRDTFAAGLGDDTVSARDGARDVVDCGPGRDTVTADRADVVRRSCELVRRR